MDMILKPLEQAAATTFACPTCAAVYEVSVQHLSMRDKDRASCFVCRKVMVEWDSTHVPFFRLVRKPDEWCKR
jgi:transcription elongation factor Elf1